MTDNNVSVIEEGIVEKTSLKNELRRKKIHETVVKKYGWQLIDVPDEFKTKEL